MQHILFNSRSRDWEWLSNLHPIKFSGPDGREYYSVEGYFQSQKYRLLGLALKDSSQSEAALGWAEVVRGIKEARKAKAAGGPRPGPGKPAATPEVRAWFQEQWMGQKLRVTVMKEALRGKFQDLELRQRLLNTGEAEIVEDMSDKFWGSGGKQGGGKNMTGRLLMELRRELKERGGSGQGEQGQGSGG